MSPVDLPQPAATRSTPKRKAALRAETLIAVGMVADRESDSRRASKKARVSSESDEDEDAHADARPVKSGRRAASASKRAAPEMPLSDLDNPGPIFDDCDEVRRKIGALLRKGEMTQAQFLRTLHVNSNSYYHFMGISREYAHSSGVCMRRCCFDLTAVWLTEIVLCMVGQTAWWPEPNLPSCLCFLRAQPYRCRQAQEQEAARGRSGIWP